MADSFPSELECLFAVPASIEDADLQRAVGSLGETLKSDLLACSAPVEVIMQAASALNQFAKHSQAARKPYGFPELGGYTDPGSERAAMSSVKDSLKELRDSMSRLRVIQANPEQLNRAREERDKAFVRVVQHLMTRAAEQTEPLCGDELQFWCQSTVFPALQEEGLAE